MLINHRTKVRTIKNLPVILLSIAVILCCLSNIRICSHLTDVESKLEEIEMTTAIITMSPSNKKSNIVSSKFFNEYLPSAEGFSDTAYNCTSGNPTIGYGTNLSRNDISTMLEYNYISVDDNGKYTMTKYQAKRAAGLWIAENNKYFEQFSERCIGIQFSELPQEIKDFIVLIAYKSGGPGLLSSKKEVGRYIGEFIDCGMDVESETFNNMIKSAGGDSNRQCVYRSMFE